MLETRTIVLLKFTACPLVCGWYAAVVISLRFRRRVIASRNLDTNWNFLSVSKYVRVPYVTIQLSIIIVVAFAKLTVLTNMALHNLAHLLVKTITCWQLNFILVTETSMAMATDFSGSATEKRRKFFSWRFVYPSVVNDWQSATVAYSSLAIWCHLN